MIRRLAALAAVAGLVAGCLDQPVATPSPTPTPQPEPTPTVTTYELGATVWYEGLLVYVDRAVATLDERGGPVEVIVRVQNEGLEDGELDGGIRLIVGGAAVEPTRESRVPTVPAGSLIGAVMTYELQGVESVDDAVVQVGEEPQHVALVPLTDAGGEPVTFEPVPIEVGGNGAAGDLRIALRTGELRWDLPDWSQELPAGIRAFTLTYDATYTGTFAGGFAFTGENVALRMPNGSIIGARRDGHSQSVELIGPGKTKKGLFSRFEIPIGLTGQFRLLVRNGSSEKAIPFTIEG